MIEFDSFSNEQALAFGLRVIDIINRENFRPVRIRVTLDNDIIFQYLMEGKTSVEWLDRKEKTVKESGHTSLYVYEHQDDYKYMLDNDQYAVCGGGYPLIIKGELRGAFVVSGLEHHEDHNLIVRALEEVRK